MIQQRNFTTTRTPKQAAKVKLNISRIQVGLRFRHYRILWLQGFHRNT